MKHLLKKFLSLLCAGLMTCGLLTGCGEEKLPEPTGELNILTPIQNDLVLMKAKSLFAKESPTVNVTYEEAGKNISAAVTLGADLNTAAVRDGIDLEQTGMEFQEYYDNQRKELMKGGARDVVFADAMYQTFDNLSILDYSKMIQSGAFTDLVPLFEAYAPEADLKPYQSLMTSDGKLYAIPYRTQAFYLQSGEQLLKDWNFAYNPEDDILTFLRKCSAWKEEAGADAPAVFSKPAWEYLYQNIFTIVGMDYVDFEKKAVHFNTPEVQEILTLLRELRSDIPESALPSPDEIKGSYGKFLFGGLYGIYDAVVYATYGAAGSFADKSLMMPLRGLDGKINMQALVYLMIPTSAANPVNGVKYLEKVMDSMQENDKTWWIWDYNQEKAEAAVNHRQYMAPYIADDYLDVLWDTYVDKGAICFPDYWLANLSDLFDNYMEGAFTPEEFVKDVDSRLRIYLSE